MFVNGDGIIGWLSVFVVGVLFFEEFRLDRVKVENVVVVLWIEGFDFGKDLVINIEGVVRLIKLFFEEFVNLLVLRG